MTELGMERAPEKAPRTHCRRLNDREREEVLRLGNLGQEPGEIKLSLNLPHAMSSIERILVSQGLTAAIREDRRENGIPVNLKHLLTPPAPPPQLALEVEPDFFAEAVKGIEGILNEVVEEFMRLKQARLGLVPREADILALSHVSLGAEALVKQTRELRGRVRQNYNYLALLDEPLSGQPA